MPNMETHKLAQIMKFPTFEKEHSPTNSVEMTSALPVKESCLVKRRKQAKVCKVTHSHRQKYLLSFGGVRFHRFSQLFTAVSCLILKKDVGLISVLHWPKVVASPAARGC